jgi:hypothetical protein
LFRGNQLCIPNCSMRENLLKEKHSGGLAGHFGHDKTFAKLSESYFWPGMRADVKRFVDRCQNLSAFEGEKAECRVFISHCPYQRDHGRRSAWILYWVCRGRREGLIPSLWWWTGFQRWHILFHARRPAMRPTSQTCFSKRF